MSIENIQPITMEHVMRYGDIYAKAFSGTSMLFHYGRTFEINDLTVDPEYHRRGIAKELLEKCLADIKTQGMVGVHLITAGEGVLPPFYAKYGFKKETQVILMGAEL